MVMNPAKTHASSAVQVGDLGPLAWVLDETRKSIESASKSLKRYAHEAEAAKGVDLASVDASQLRMARQQLHQVVGALDMVGQTVASYIVKSMEAAVSQLVQKPEKCTEQAAKDIELCGFALVEYLECQLGEHPRSALGLFQQFKKVQEIAGADRIHPADLWEFSWRWADPVTPPAPESLAYSPEVRSRLDQRVLKIMKHADANAAAEIGVISLDLSEGENTRNPKIFWKISAGFFEGLGKALVSMDLYAKRMASRVLLQYTTLAKGDHAVSERLAQDLLFFCAQAEPFEPSQAPILAAIRKAWKLDKYPRTSYMEPSFGLYDPSVLQQARRRVEATKENWSALAGGDMARLKACVDQFGLVVDSLNRLHSKSKPLADAIARVSQQVAASGQPPSPELAMETATAVLFLEASFDEFQPNDQLFTQRLNQLATRLDTVREGATAPALESWMEELYRSVSDRQTMGTVISEVRTSLDEIEQHLDQFFRSPADKAPIQNVPTMMGQMRGVLSVLGLEQASMAVAHMKTVVEGWFTSEVNVNEPKTSETIERLGSSLGALGFLIDMMGYQPILARKLFIYDEETKELKHISGRLIDSHFAVEEEHEDEEVEQIAAAPSPVAPVAVELPAVEIPAVNVPAVELPAVEVTKLQEVKLPEVELATPVAVSAPVSTPTSAPVPVPAPAPVAPAPVVAAPAQDDFSDEDDDLLDIFLEEAREVVQTGLAAIGSLKTAPSDMEQQTTLRRAFHTLKGSSRMVGLTEFGEAAWSLEQLLNAWLAEKKPVSEDLTSLSEESMQAFGNWAEDIASKQAGHWRAQPFKDAADSLRMNNKRIPLVLSGSQPAAPEVATAEVITPEPVAQPVVQEVVTPEIASVSAAPVIATVAAAASVAAVAEVITAPAPVEEPTPAPVAIEPEITAEPIVIEAIEPAQELAQEESIANFELPDLELSEEIAAPVIEPVSIEEIAPAQVEPLAAQPLEAMPDFNITEGEVEVVSLDSDSLLAPEESDIPEVVEELSFDIPEAAPELATPELSAVEVAPEVAAPEVVPIEPEPSVDVVEAFEPFAQEEVTFSPTQFPSSIYPLAADSAFGLQSLPVEPVASVEPVQEVVAPVVAPDPVVEPIPAAPIATPEVVAIESEIQPIEVQRDFVAPDGTESLMLDLSELDFTSDPAVVNSRLDAVEPVEVAREDALPLDLAELNFVGTQQPEVSSVFESSSMQDNAYKQIGDLRVSTPLYNVYMSEADEWSRYLVKELSEWSLDLGQAVPERAIAKAHSLAGSSATVGFASLSEMARAVEHALQRLTAQPRGTAKQATVLSEAADDIRRVVSDFGAGVLRQPSKAILVQVQALEPTEGEANTQMPIERFEPAIASPAKPAAVQKAAPILGVKSSVISDDIDVQDAVDPDLFPIFEEEAEELFPALGTAMRQWVSHPDERSARAQVLRSLHTLKGSARLAGALRLGEMAHRVESAIETLGIEDISSSDLETIQDHIDELETAFQYLQSGESYGAGVEGAYTANTSVPIVSAPPAVPAAAPITPIEAPTPAVSPVAAPSTIEPIAAKPAVQELAPVVQAAPILEPIAVTQVQAVQPVVEQPASAPVQAAPEKQSFVPEAALVTAAKAENAAQVVRGEVALPAPLSMVSARAAATQAVRVRSQLLDRLVAQAGEVVTSRARLEAEIGQLRGSLNELTGNLERLRLQLRDVELQAETQMQSRLALSKDSQKNFDPLEFDRFTRMQELTRMMAESVNDVATVQRSLQRAVEASEDDLAAQARQSRELQRDLLRTRMVEFESISERLYRVVRQASKETGKQVRLDIVGGSIEMDRGILERMTSAFEHLLRNCVVHGIETQAVRSARSKEPAGLVSIEVQQAGNDVSVEFRDDGAGLNLPRIRERAIQQGLITPDQKLSNAEIGNLIFASGFTTATEVTELAGRGVGMDVVRTEVQALGGRIETATREGLGSSFRLVLPLTTAVTHVVMVRTGQLSIGVPSNLVEIVHRTSEKELLKSFKSGLYQFGDEQIPFFCSSALLQNTQDNSPAPDSMTQSKTTPVVIFRSAAQRVAVHVDEVLGNQEVVVKALGTQLSRLPGLVAITALASGAVALIYNPVALAAVYGQQARELLACRIQQKEQAQTPQAADAAATAGAVQVPQTPLTAPQSSVPLVMVVDDSITVRRVTQRLLQREGYRVVLAADGLQGLEKLQGERPSVILSDIEMPRMDGFDFVRNIRADAKLATLPVIMITSRIAEKHREHARELGVDHYLGKPYSEEELLALIKEYSYPKETA